MVWQVRFVNVSNPGKFVLEYLKAERDNIDQITMDLYKSLGKGQLELEMMDQFDCLMNNIQFVDGYLNHADDVNNAWFVFGVNDNLFKVWFEHSASLAAYINRNVINDMDQQDVEKMALVEDLFDVECVEMPDFTFVGHFTLCKD